MRKINSVDASKDYFTVYEGLYATINANNEDIIMLQVVEKRISIKSVSTCELTGLSGKRRSSPFYRQSKYQTK